MSPQQFALPLAVRQLPREPEHDAGAIAAKALARAADPETSKRAAQRVESFKAGHEAKCYAAICEAGTRGATSDEIAAATGLTLVQVCRRLGKMGERKLIVRRLKEQPRNPRDFEARDGMSIWWRA